MKVVKLIVLLLLFSSCQQEDTLEKVPYEAYLAMIHENRLPDMSDLKKVDQHGREIPQDSLAGLHRRYDLREELYRNESGEIVEIRFQPKPPIGEIEIDCASMDSQLDSVRALDQAARNMQTYDPRADYANLAFVVNVIEQCGMPESRSSLDAVFLILQHNHGIYQKKYIDRLRAAAEQGKLKRSSVAMMEDRILVDDGKPQIYGTQVSRKRGGEWRLNDLLEPERVNIRRARVGLGPIEEYLKNFDIEFDVEQETVQ